MNFWNNLLLGICLLTSSIAMGQGNFLATVGSNTPYELNSLFSAAETIKSTRLQFGLGYEIEANNKWAFEQIFYYVVNDTQVPKLRGRDQENLSHFMTVHFLAKYQHSNRWQYHVGARLGHLFALEQGVVLGGGTITSVTKGIDVSLIAGITYRLNDQLSLHLTTDLVYINRQVYELFYDGWRIDDLPPKNKTISIGIKYYPFKNGKM